MSYSTTKLILAISLVLFFGVADLAFGQRGRVVQRPQQQSEQPQQPQQGAQQQRMRQPAIPMVPQQRVLIVAAGRLPDAPNFGGLNGADFDADALAHAFEKTGIPRENIVFQSENGWTQEAVLGRLEEMKMSSRPGDSLVVVLIGKTVQKHGLHYFCAADTTDSAITSNTNTGLVRISALADQISGTSATHKALILDLVGNGGFPDFSNLEPQGLWLLTSAATGEDSLREVGLIPGSREVRGAFNYYLTRGLLGMADLIGNNDGVVSFNELSNYATQNTRAHAERGGTRQTPQMLGTMVQQVGKAESVFNIGQKREGTFAANLHVFDESHLIKSLSDYLASVGNAIVMSVQADLRQAFAGANEKSIQSIGKENADVADVTDYLKRQGDANTFAIANFLNPALNDPENKMARLAIATAKRACGDYIDALRNYDDAGELFELYVVDRLGDMGEEATAREKRSSFGNDLTLELVPLHFESSATSRAVAQLKRGEKVFAQEYAMERSGHPNDGWLKVRVYPYLEPKYVEGWVHRDYIYWSPEAAEWYTPEDGLMRMYAGNAERFEIAAKRLDSQAEALEADARAREIRAQRLKRAAELAQRLGLPYAGDIALVLNLLSEVARLRSQAQHVRAQANRIRAMDAWDQSVHWQQVGAEYRSELKTVEDQTKYFEGARIIIEPNNLPF